MDKFRKLNRRPLKITFTKAKEPRALFHCYGKPIYLDKVIRKDSPWAGETDLPDYIHGVYDEYPTRLYVEISPNGETANLWKKENKHD